VLVVVSAAWSHIFRDSVDFFFFMACFKILCCRVIGNMNVNML
jgi:hypothetical protein